MKTVSLAKSCGKALFFLVLAKVTGVLGIHLGKIVGSWGAHFSGASAVIPLIGAFGGSHEAVLVGLCSFVLQGSLGLSFGKMCAYSIPGMCAALCWSRTTVFEWVLLPLVCMALFVLHPVGSQAWVYSLYWLIPVLLFTLSKKSLLVTALASTFVAHAVGSVIWLYTIPMTASMWLSLICIVPLERMVIACSMLGVRTMLKALISLVSYLQKQWDYYRTYNLV